MIQFRDTQGTGGVPLGYQATKTDLVDIARAIGVLTATDENSVDELRGLIRTQLPTFAPKRGRQATKADLFGIALALGIECQHRPKGITVGQLRHWIRAVLSRQFHAGESVRTPKGRGVVVEQGARVAVRIVDGPLEYFWPGELR